MLLESSVQAEIDYPSGLYYEYHSYSEPEIEIVGISLSGRSPPACIDAD